MKHITIVCTVLLLSLNACDNEEQPIIQPGPTPQSVPVITLSCSDTVVHTLNYSFFIPSATANDAEDGDLTAMITISSNVNSNLAGLYVLEYSVMDSDSNVTRDTVHVIVANWAESLGGVFVNCIDSCAVTPLQNYSSTVVVSSTSNGQIAIGNFAGTGATISAYVTQSGNFNVPANQPLDSGNTLVAGGGSVTNTSTGEFKIDYTWFDGLQYEVCTTYFYR